tara:strand:+ start:2173 stop:2637 length:465 start_codon:yes stop_codon:yes gene_type:complete
MSKVENISNVQKIDKPWGHEIWLASYYNDSKYALKEILIKAPHKSSIQFHEAKEETNYIQSGTGLLMLSKDPIDIKKFKDGEYSKDDLSSIVSSLESIELTKGVVFHIKPGYIHRVIALTDLLMIEASTLELDDVFRIQDDSNRGHGKIDSEHR